MPLLQVLRPTLPILIGASLMLTLSMGLRQSFGIFMQPLTRDIGISVSQFTLALAVQNLACYVDTHDATAESSAGNFRLVGMPVTYLVGTSNHIEGYIAGAPDWLSPAGARLLQFYREQT